MTERGFGSRSVECEAAGGMLWSARCYNIRRGDRGLRNKGIIYVMTSSVVGLVKIGQTEAKSFKGRMKQLKNNGYYNIAGLDLYFAIEVAEYKTKEKLLHEVFSKHRVGSSEFFALDKSLIKELLQSFEGRVIHPAEANIEHIKPPQKHFAENTKVGKKAPRFSFSRKGLKPGERINFLKDPEITAIIHDDRRVEYVGKLWHLSPLAKELLNSKGYSVAWSCNGPSYWTYGGVRLNELPDA